MIDKAFNTIPLTAVTGSLCCVLGIAAPEFATESINELIDYVARKTDGKGVDRLVIYNPDAIAEWIVEQYPAKFATILDNTELTVPMLSMYPPKTPVCFGSIYSGATPSEHGIEKYVKVELKIDTFFDALVRSGKKTCIITVQNQSMDILFRGRDIDYFAFATDEQVVAKAEQLIADNIYDVMCIYNQAYDDAIHYTHPKSRRAKRAIDACNSSYGRILNAVSNHYQDYDTLVGALTDHGVHREWYLLGTHGKNIPQDMNINHYYKVINKTVIKD